MATFNELLGTYNADAAETDQAIREEKERKLNPVEGYPFWPHEVLRDTTIALLFFSAILFLAAFLPYYLEVPADPSGQPAVILPDWYLLWTYGMLKIANDVTIGGGFSGLSIFGWHPFPIMIMEAKLWGIAMQGLLIGLVAVVPFLDRGRRTQRPVEQPFWASLGFAGLVFVLMISVYSINTVIYPLAPMYAAPYGKFLADYFTVFRFDLLAWITMLTPLAAFFLTYVPLWRYKKAHGYEARLAANYYETR